MDEFEPRRQPSDLIDLAGAIVVAYVAHNPVPASALPELIATTHAALSSIGSAVVAAEPEPASSSAQVRRSIRPDGLTSFLDGRTYKTLKRHLRTHGLTPPEYRAKFGLPVDYPMTCASYSEARSALAKGIGLGQGQRKHMRVP